MTTKKLISLISFTVLALSTIHGQNDDNTVLKIRKVYQKINSYKNYKIVTIDNSEDFLGEATDNGGTLKGYYKDDTLQKIVEWIGLSNRVIENEYYFDNNKLVFVYATESNYHVNDSTQSLDYTKLDKSFEGRYYFDNEKLIDAVLSDKGRNKTKQSDADRFLASTRDYKKILKAKKT